jgi:predicted nucleic acid-binding protein
MQFFDTNVLIYGFVKNVDDKHQQQTSINLIENALSSDSFVISDIVLYEFAFVAKKLEEKKENIDNFLKFLSTFSRHSNSMIANRTLELLNKSGLYKSSFDINHLAFCEFYELELITFDKGFKSLSKYSDTKIRLL